MQDDKDSSVYASDEPDVSALIKEYQRCGLHGNAYGKTKVAEDIRLARWDGQSDDGKKHSKNLNGRKAFPWEGASDVRCYQADEVINEHVAIDMAAFWRSELRLRPIGPEDTNESGAATTYMDWLRYTKLHRDLDNEVEYSSQFRHTYAWSALHVMWEREVGLRNRKIQFDALVQTAQQLAQTPPEQVPPQYREIAPLLAVFPDLIASGEQDQTASEILKLLYRSYVKENLPKELTDDNIPELKTKRARKAVRELREKQETTIPMPYLCKNQPCIRALKPWRDIVVNNYAADIQSHPHIFLPVYLTEAELRSMELSDQWEKDWIEQAVKTKGKVSDWQEGEGVEPEIQWNSFDAKSELIEVLFCYSKLIDDDGVMGVYLTVISPHFANADKAQKDIYAKHELIDAPGGRYPIIIAPRERLDRSITACRGIPEILSTSQREEKVQRDSLVDLTSMCVVPPLLLPKMEAGGQDFDFSPGRHNRVNFGREPRLMDIPTKGMVPSIEYMAIIQQRRERYFGQFSETVPPQLSQMIMEPNVRRFLTAWGEALYLAYLLSRKYAPELIERVTGTQIVEDENFNPGEYDLAMNFDVTVLNHELLMAKLEAFSNLIPEDSEGVLDKGGLVRIKANALDPAIARQLITDKTTATTKIKESVENDIMKMFNGNPANIRDASKDPTAPTRLQHAQQVVMDNHKYLGALDREVFQGLFMAIPPQYLEQIPNQPDPIFTQEMEKYLKNLEQGVNQLENRSTGRTGVKQGAA
jgi:hypothetical protein